MTKLGSLLARKPVLVANRSAAPAAAAPASDTVVPLMPVEAVEPHPAPVAEAPAPAPAPVAAPVERSLIEMDQDLFFPMVSQLGEENEAVRNLLIDAEHKIGELETIKRSIGRLVDPVSKTLRAFEEAKSEKLTLQSQINNARVAQAKLRDDLAASERRGAVLDAECTRLREVVAIAQQSVNALENTKNEQSAELNARRSQISDLQRQLNQQSTELQVTRDDAHRYAERITVLERRLLSLEAEATAAQQKFLMSDKERIAIQAMLDKSLDEAAQFSRRVLDADKALGTAQAQIQQLEGSLRVAEADRARLTASLEQMSDQMRADAMAAHAKTEALQARVAISDKLLGEARQTLAARAQEMGAFERRVSEATYTRDAIETRFGQVERALADRDQQIKTLEQARAAMAERADLLERAVASRENAYNRAQEKITDQENLVQLLEGQLRAAKETTELQLEDLRAQLQRERLERSMAEGALEAGRKDIARLLRELSSLQNSAQSGAISEDTVAAALARFRSAA